MVVIPWVALTETSGSAEGKFLLKRAKDVQKDEGGEKGAEWAALGKAFGLKKAVPQTKVIDVPAFVVGTT